MITGKQEELDQIVQTHECPEHPDKALTVAWLKDQGYVIRCGGDHYPIEVTRVKTLTEIYKEGVELPEPIKSNVEKRLAKQAPQRPAPEIYKSLGITPSTDLGSGALLSPGQVQLLVNYANRYELDLFLGHAVIMYGKPYPTIDGYLYHAHQVNVPYSLNTRPFTDSERAASLIEDGDHAWQSEVVKIPSGASFMGIGIVTKEEMTEISKKTPGRLRSPIVAAHPWQLAQKRAEWQALRRAFPLGTQDEKEEG